jgi:hypothetical protein
VSRSNDDLIEVLARTLAPEAAEPSAAELGAFRQAISARRPTPAPRSPSWRCRPLPVILAIALVTSSAGSAWAVQSGNLPRPVRELARAVGLPLDSPAMADARRALADLRAAVDSKDPASVRRAEATLRSREAHLGGKDQRRIEAKADRLLARAQEPPLQSPTATGGGADTSAPADQAAHHDGHVDGSSGATIPSTPPQGSDGNGQQDTGRINEPTTTSTTSPPASDPSPPPAPAPQPSASPDGQPDGADDAGSAPSGSSG